MLDYLKERLVANGFDEQGEAWVLRITFSASSLIETPGRALRFFREKVAWLKSPVVGCPKPSRGREDI